MSCTLWFATTAQLLFGFQDNEKKKYCQLRVKSALTQPSKKVGPTLTMGTGLMRHRDKSHKVISMGSCQLSDH